MRAMRYFPALLIMAGLAPAAWGQTLADKVPADAVLYVGWQGSDAAGPAYQASHFKAMLEALNVSEQLAAMAKDRQAKLTDAALAEQDKLFSDWLALVTKSPTALYLGPTQFVAGKGKPHVAVFSKVGKEVAAPLAEKMSAVMKRNQKEGDAPGAVVAVGDYLLVTFGEGIDIADRLGGAKADSLADLKEFKESFTKLSAGMGGGKIVEAPASMFVNWDHLMNTLDDRAQASTNANYKRLWPRMTDALGLDEARYVAWSGSFDGQDWKSEAFVAFNAGRTGLMGLLDNKPLPEETFKRIPANVSTAGVLRFDGERLLTDLRDAAGRSDERGAQQFDAMIKQAFMVTGINIQKDLFPALSDQFVYYSSPDATGLSMRGLTLINKLRDPVKGADSMARISDFIDAATLQRDPDSKMLFQEAKLAVPLDKVVAHTINLPNIQPTWAINEGTLFISASSAGVQSAVEFAGKPKDSLLDNADFAALRKKLSVEKFSSFMFYDLRKTAPEIYEMASQGIAKAEAQDPAKKLPLALPPFDKLKPHLGAGLDVYWSDEAGFHMRGIGPFPLSNALTPNGLLEIGAAQNAITQFRARRAGGAAAPAKPPAKPSDLP